MQSLDRDFPDRARRLELGAFVRAHRERLSPAAVGLAAGPRRRTPGLRREEVAQLSGLSTTWYSWIEQGREVSISPAALLRLARVLRLAPAERAYLFDLAGKRDPEAASGQAPAPPAALVAAVRAQPWPAYLLDRGWTALAWNAAAAELFVGWLDGEGDRNLLRYIFLNPATPALLEDWEGRARRALAEFRADYSRHLEDPALRALVQELSERSAVFARAWNEHVVLGREGGERRFRHPRLGALAFEQVTLAPAGHPDLKLVLLVPPDAGPQRRHRR